MINSVNVRDHVEITVIFSGVMSTIKYSFLNCVLFIDLFQTWKTRIRRIIIGNDCEHAV